MNDLYIQGKYLENNPSWHIEDSAWKADNILKIVEKNHLNYKTICEVGCGAGEILNQLYNKTDQNISFWGYEISPQAFNICKEKQKDRLVYLKKDILNEKDVYYDILLLIDVLEHVENYFDFIRKLREKAVYKIFHIPLDISVQSVLRVSPILGRRKSVGHIHYFTKETALETLNDCGYQIIDYFFTSGSIDLARKGLKAKLLKISRKAMYSINKDLAARVLGGFSLLVLAK
jgi:hypothetical protein